MNNEKNTGVLRSSQVVTAYLLFCCCMIFPLSAGATAPRIVPQLFGEERKSDIVAYQAGTSDEAARAEVALMVDLASEAFAAAGKTLAVDVLPSKQLAKYALTSGEAIALIGVQGDLTAQEKEQYRTVVFYLRGSGATETPVVLVVSKKHPRGNELHQAFNQGLQKLVKSGKYAEILEKHQGGEQVSADYFSRLKRYNSSLK